MDDIELNIVGDTSADKNTAVKNNQDAGFDTDERLTLKIDVNEAQKYQLKKTKKNVVVPRKNTKKTKTKRIRENYDEEDDYEDDEEVLRSLRLLEQMQQEASNGDNSLLQALNANERQPVLQKITTQTTHNEENAGRQNAVFQAEHQMEKANMHKMNTIEFMQEMHKTIYDPIRIRQHTLEDNIAKQIGIKGKITSHNEGNVVKGVRKIQEVSGKRQVKNINIKDAENIGKRKLSTNKTAELLLIKSGQTARLSELKHKSPSSTNKKHKTTNKSYTKEMRELLRKSLQKNKKQR